MKKFLTVIKTSFIQIAWAFGFSIIKYLLVEFELSDKIQTPFLLVFSGSIVLLIIAIAIIGIIENGGRPFEMWEEESKAANRNLFLIKFISWSKIISAILAFLFFAYLFTPTSYGVFIILAGLIIIKNIIVIYSSNKTDLNQEVQ